MGGVGRGDETNIYTYPRGSPVKYSILLALSVIYRKLKKFVFSLLFHERIV